MLQKIISLFKLDRTDIFGTRSYQWTKVRKEFLELNPSCKACGRNKNLEVHHIKPYHLYPDLEYDFNNLITLCDDPCHFVFGHLMNYKSWNENVIEDCELFYNKIRNRP